MKTILVEYRGYINNACQKHYFHHVLIIKHLTIIVCRKLWLYLYLFWILTCLDVFENSVVAKSNTISNNPFGRFLYLILKKYKTRNVWNKLSKTTRMQCDPFLNNWIWSNLWLTIKFDLQPTFFAVDPLKHKTYL